MVLSIIALAVSLVALVFTGWAAWATSKQADAAIAQTEIQRKQADAAIAQTEIQRKQADAAIAQTAIQREQVEAAVAQTAIQREQVEAALAQTEIQREQVTAAREETQLQRDLAREAQQPYVWADIQPDMQQGTVMHIAVGNAGPSAARNVRVTFDPPLPSGEQQSDRIKSVQAVLAKGLHSLAPNRVIRWSLGAGFDLIASDTPQPRTVRIEAEGPYGPLPPVELLIDIAQWRQARDAPDGSLHHVRGSIKDLTAAVKKVDATLRRVGDDLASPRHEVVNLEEIGDSFVRSEQAKPQDGGEEAGPGPGAAQLPPR